MKIGKKKIQAAAYNGARTVFKKEEWKRSVATLKVVFSYSIKIIKYGKTTFKRISKIIIQVELIYMVRNQKISFVGFYC